jgi:glycosyltransferase involved in cell wall biosynthesis
LAGIAIVRTRHLSVPLRRNPFASLVYSKLCDRIVTTGETIRQLLIRAAGVKPSKVISVPTGVDLEQFDPLRGDGEAVRKELGIAKDIPLIGMVAVLRSWKGHRLFLEAVPLVLEKVPQARFLIVGDGPQEGNIQRWIEEMGLKEMVVMTGHREDIPEVLAALDVVVSASTAAEGVPQVLVQALAMKKPVVATDVGGVGEIIRDRETGLLVPPGNPKALAEAALAILSNPEVANALGRQGRELVERSYRLEKMLDHIEAVYQDLIAPRR